jgi:hypothetical protein
MAEEPSLEDDYDYMDDDEDYEMFDDDALTSFRMFHQRTNDEDIEEESDDEDEDDDDDDETLPEPTSTAPNIETFARQLTNRGVTFEELVTYVLWAEQRELRIEREAEREQYYRTYNAVYGQFRAVIHNHRRNRRPAINV